MSIKVKRNILSIILILWMGLVFFFSHQQGDVSSKTSEGFIKQILEMIPGITNMSDVEKENLIENIHLIVRKLAHFSIYAVGGIIMFLWLIAYDFSIPKAFIMALGMCFIYAVSDEIHQTFIADRSGEIRDVCIDTLGALTGISIVLLLKKIKEKFFVTRQPKQPN